MSPDVPCAIHCSESTIERPTWPAVWMAIAHRIAERSCDPRTKVGAIVVTDDNTQLLSLGYNGNYKGGPNTVDSSDPGLSGFLHAELNCLIKCDFNHPKSKTMYVTVSPCRACSKAIINADIKRLVYDVNYRDTSGLELLRSVGIEVLSLDQAILMSKS